MQKGFTIAVFLGFLMFVLNFNAFADENPAPASNSADDQAVSRKLDNVIDAQAQILKELDEIKAELQVIKIRASER